MEKELKIMTATVSIQLITVDGKKMTKAVFSQIEVEDCFDKKFQFIGSSFLGYVISDGCKWLLWIKNGELRKTSLKFLEDISNLNLKDYCHRVKSLTTILLISYPKRSNIDWEIIDKTFSADNLDLFLKSKKEANCFLEKLNGNQLYIAI